MFSHSYFSVCMGLTYRKPFSVEDSVRELQSGRKFTLFYIASCIITTRKFKCIWSEKSNRMLKSNQNISSSSSIFFLYNFYSIKNIFWLFKTAIYNDILFSIFMINKLYYVNIKCLQGPNYNINKFLYLKLIIWFINKYIKYLTIIQ
jgi:hypothetical protein